MNIYLTIKELIISYIFGGAVNAGSYEELVTILVATASCLFCFAIPFLVVYKFVQWVARI